MSVSLFAPNFQTRTDDFQRSLHQENNRRRSSKLKESTTEPLLCLPEVFDSHFEVLPADTPERRLEAHRLRYQVYCVEHPFEDAAAHPDQLERDSYDSHAVHCLLVHRPSGMTAGTVRLILPRSGTLHNCFPIQIVCPDKRLQPDGPLPLESCAEASRLAISRQFRQYMCERKRAGGVPGAERNLQDEAGLLPYLALGLFRAIMQMCVTHGITHIFTIPDACVLRLYRRFGFTFKALGPWIEFHGRRLPSYSSVFDLIGWDSPLHHTRPHFWRIITNDGELVPR